MTTTIQSRTHLNKEASYQDFLSAIAALDKEGHPQTLDAIREKLGKYSRSTLVEHRTRWLAEQEQLAQVNAILSESFQKATLAEIGRATQTLKDQHQQLIDHYKQQMREYQRLRDETHQELESVKQELVNQIAMRQERELNLEKRLAAEHALVQQAERQLQELRQELKEQAQGFETRLQESVKVQTAKANTRVDELTKQLTELKVKQKK